MVEFSTTVGAEELVAEGRFIEAIEALNSANRVQRDLAIEARLVQLRRDAPRPVCVRTEEQWPPRVRNRFWRGGAIPEIARNQLTAKALRKGIFKHGCLLVRGLSSEQRVDELVQDVDRSVSAYDESTRGQVEVSPWFRPFSFPAGDPPRDFIRKTGGVLAVDSPPSLFDVIETFEEFGLRDIATQFFGETPLLLATKCTLRRATPKEIEASTPETALDFHQDGAFMGPDTRALNLWLSLSHCGVDAPGLDVVPKRLDKIVDTGIDGALLDWTVSDSSARRVAREEIVSPIFKPGDALFFDHMLLHRTGWAPGMTKERYAIEAWFVASSSTAENTVTY